METAEEKAREYADREIPIVYTDEAQTVSLTELRHAAKIDYLAGYNEATRWRDPNIDRPDYYKKVVVKYERDDLKIDHECVSLLADDDGAYFFGNYRFDIIIDFDKVIGWRPIVTTLEEFKENLNISNVRSSYSSELGKLQKELKDAEHRYVYGKDTIEQNKANFDMVIILNKIRKLKGLEE